MNPPFFALPDKGFHPGAEGGHGKNRLFQGEAGSSVNFDCIINSDLYLAVDINGGSPYLDNRIGNVHTNIFSGQSSVNTNFNSLFFRHGKMDFSMFPAYRCSFDGK